MDKSNRAATVSARFLAEWDAEAEKEGSVEMLCAFFSHDPPAGHL